MTNNKYYEQIAIIGGNILEWYDYSLYGLLATIIANFYFPMHNYLNSLILTFGISAIGNFIKPLGGLVLGIYGDRYGYRRLLILTVCGVTSATIFMGILPSYAMIGVLAPISVFILRILQGFFISVEFGGSTSYLLEFSNQKNKGFLASLPQVSVFLGGLLATGVVAITNLLITEQNINNWAWRIPFIISGLLGLIISYLRCRYLLNGPFNSIKKPLFFLISLREVVKHKNKILMATIITCAASSSVGYLGYQTNFMIAVLHKTLLQASILSFITSLIVIILIPLYTRIADKVGYRNLMMNTLWLCIVLAYPLFYLMANRNYVLISIGQIIFSILIASYLSVFSTYIAELIPKSIRVSCFAAGYNIGVVLFNGSVPVISFYLIKVAHNNLMPVWYYILTCSISLLALNFINQSTNKLKA